MLERARGAATEQGDGGELSHRLAAGAQDSQGHGGVGGGAVARLSGTLGENRAPLRRYFPWVHIVLLNLKRFLLGTHPKPEAKHLPRYVAEFAYRFNRRRQELFDRLTRACLSTNTITITYKDLVAEPEVA